MNFLKTVIQKIALIMVLSFSVGSAEANLKQFNVTLAAKTWLKSLVTTVAHELGHAIAAKALWNQPVNISIGASNPQEEAPWFSTKYLSIIGLSPFTGFQKTSSPQTIDPQTNIRVLDRKKKAIELLAGGISGALINVAINCAEKGIVKESFFNYFIAEEIFENILIPNGSSDGYANDARKLWEQCFGIKVPSWLGKLQPCIVPGIWIVNCLRQGGLGEKEREYCMKHLLAILSDAIQSA